MPRNSDTLAATAVVDQRFRRHQPGRHRHLRRASGRLAARSGVSRHRRRGRRRGRGAAAGGRRHVARHRGADGRRSTRRCRLSALPRSSASSPSSLRNRLISKDGKAALVTFRLPDLYASELAEHLAPAAVQARDDRPAARGRLDRPDRSCHARRLRGAAHDRLAAAEQRADASSSPSC